MLTDYFKPTTLIRALDSIDREPPSHSLNRLETLKRLNYTLLLIALSLLLVEYFKLFRAFRELVQFIDDMHIIRGLDRAIFNSSYRNLYSYMWWTAWQVIAYVLLPIIFIKLVLKQRVRDFGWRWGDTTAHWRPYALLLAPMLIGVVIVSYSETFSSYYPMYRDADRSWFDLLAWEFLFILQFICVEFFYRGFILHALRPAIGAGAIAVMCVPYMMIHFPKPMFESLVALSFGILASVLAYRSRSIWGGVILHVCVAVLMDITALIQKNQIPVQFWPPHY